MAFLIPGSNVNEPVQHAALGIEPGDDFIKVSGILKIVSTPNSPGDEIGDLDNTRGLRIDEERHFSHVAEFSPARSLNAKRAGETLKRAFIVRLVHDDEAAMLSFLVST